MNTYHAIYISGNKTLTGGRNIAGYRLRTSAKQHGYNVFILDNATALSQHALLELISKAVTKGTLCFAFSSTWFESIAPDRIGTSSIDWINDSFFNQLKEKYPNISILAGGQMVTGYSSRMVYKHCDWHVTGFADFAFVELLNFLSGKTTDLKYSLDSNNKKYIDSNANYKVTKPDDLETVFEECDGLKDYQPLPLEVSRGCIFQCAFCSHPFQGLKDPDAYIRSPESLARELRRNYELFGTTRYAVLDDTFNDSIEKISRLKRAIELAKLPDFKFVSYIKPELLVTKPEMIGQLADVGLAGGFMGIESLHQPARKIIHKGMDINKILDATANLVSKTDAHIAASFIAGISNDTEELIRRGDEFLTNNQKTLFKAWFYSPLFLLYDKNLVGISEMDKDPKKFGYKVFDIKPNNFANWQNDSMSFEQAVALATELSDAADQKAYPAGWFMATAWHVGSSDIDIKTKRLPEHKLGQKGILYNQMRTKELLKLCSPK